MIKKKKLEQKKRTIDPLSQRNSDIFSNNVIKTSKYTIYNFIFKNLWEQFHRFANIYFLFILILNFMPGINAFAKEIAPIPVIIVLSLTAVKDAVEDVRRHVSDKRINKKKILKYDRISKYVEDKWENLYPGDFIKLKTNEMIPADIILIKSSDPVGIAFIETSNLDGENNLKQRESLKIDNFIYSNPNSFAKFTVEVEGPNPEIYHFSGCVKDGDQTFIMKKENILLRGCILRNTDLVEGMVVYTGHETKAMLNNTGSVFKRTKLETNINKDILWCILILVVVCLTGAIGSGVWQQSFPTNDVLFLALNPESSNSSPAFQAFINFWTYIIIFQSIIPLPLYVTLEFVKMHQVWHIQQDVNLYDEKTNKRIEVRSFKIPEDLGQIDYVFCDKTGTLTENKMIFKKASIYGVEYQDETFDDQISTQDESIELNHQNSQSTDETDLFQQSCCRNLNEIQKYVDLMSFNNPKDSLYTIEKPQNTQEIQYIADYFLILAICNTTVVSVNKNKPIDGAVRHILTITFACYLTMLSFGLYWSICRKRGKGEVFLWLVFLIVVVIVIKIIRLSTKKKHKNPLGSKKKRISTRLSKSGNIFKSLPKFNSKNSSSSSINELENNRITQQECIRQLSIVREESFRGDSSDGGITTEFRGPHGWKENTINEEKFESIDLIHNSPPKSNSLNDLSNETEIKKRSLVQASFHNSQTEENFSGIQYDRNSSLMSSQMSFCSTCPVDEELLPSLYESESPDELTLVKVACKYNCKLTQRSLNSVQVYMPDKTLGVISILTILPFDSIRKRMSIIIRHPNTNEIVLLSKGADSAILPKLSQNEEENPVFIVRSTKQQIKNFSKSGLRTLVLAKRVLTEDYFQEWSNQLKSIESSYSDDKENEMQKVYNKIEDRFILIGATGIEDKLQENVSDTIDKLRSASMKVWILTGDKQETAISIAYSAKLFSEDQRLLQLNAASKDEAYAKLKECIREIKSSKLSTRILRSTQDGYLNQNFRAFGTSQIQENEAGSSQGLSNNSESNARLLPVQDFALVIDGETLSHLIDTEDDPEHEDKIKQFINLCRKCSSVVCCRATPLQKAKIVTLIKNKLNVLTLAIGDGANDVNMIQAANVGIGISGQEGMQAVMASDYAITQFKYLSRLILVHGHWCYNKLARTALYLYYKNAIYIFTMFWFQIFNGFSGCVSFDQLSQVLFAITLTGLPPFILGIWDKPINDRILMENPCLYQDGIRSRAYRPWHFWINILDALWQSLVIYFLCHSTLADSSIDIWRFGQVKMNALVIVSITHMMVISKCLTFLHFFISFLSYFLFWFVFMILYNLIAVTSISPESPHYTFIVNLQDPLFYSLMVLILPTALLPRILISSIRNSTAPSLTTIAQVLAKRFDGVTPIRSLEAYMPQLSYQRKFHRGHKKSRKRIEEGREMLEDALPEVRIMKKVNRILSRSEELMFKRPDSLYNHNQVVEKVHKRNNTDIITDVSNTITTNHKRCQSLFVELRK